jgi:hypothetical protein
MFRFLFDNYPAIKIKDTVGGNLIPIIFIKQSQPLKSITHYIRKLFINGAVGIKYRVTFYLSKRYHYKSVLTIV